MELKINGQIQKPENIVQQQRYPESVVYELPTQKSPNQKIYYGYLVDMQKFTVSLLKFKKTPKFELLKSDINCKKPIEMTLKYTVEEAVKQEPFMGGLDCKCAVFVAVRNYPERPIVPGYRLFPETGCVERCGLNTTEHSVIGHEDKTIAILKKSDYENYGR